MANSTTPMSPASLSFQQIVQVHDLIDLTNDPSRIPAANLVLDHVSSSSNRCRTVGDANAVLKSLLQRLLDEGIYARAAALCWGVGELFDPRPESVRRIWAALRNESQLMIPGAGSLGKSYTVMAHDLLDWARDPYNTTVKIVSTTAGHARANTFSTLVRFHRMSAVPLPGYIKQGFIGLDKDDKRSSIAEVAIPAGEDGKARLQGYHPLPRSRPHPVFGRLTRVRVRLDEAEDIANGVWQGADNLLLAKDARGSVQIAGMFNPKRRDSMASVKCEPVGGWATFSLDRSLTWKSKDGWTVVRLDGARCENVIQQKEVFPGLLTYEGYMNLADRGESSPAYMTFARGAWPTESATFNVVPHYILDNIRGTFIWGKTPNEIGTLDSAFEEEGDDALFTAGKYGQAIAFQPESGDLVRFDPPRWAIQIEQQFPVQKGNTVHMGQDIIQLCRMLRIRPEWFAMDRTGNATGLCDWLYLNYGDLLGFQWGEKATEVPILEEDSEPAIDLYDDVVTEMFFGFGRWSEFGFVAFSPHMDTSKVFAQLAGRKYKRISKTKMKIESKKDFKKHYGGDSPNEADSVVMTVHLVRQRDRDRNIAAMEPRHREPQEDYTRMPEGQIMSIDSESAIDKIDFVYSDQ